MTPSPAELEAVTSKVTVPAAVGVPIISSWLPVASKDRPAGMAPEVTV